MIYLTIEQKPKISINEQPEVAKELEKKWNDWYTGITGLDYEAEKERKKKAKKAGNKAKAEKKNKLRKSAGFVGSTRCSLRYRTWPLRYP